MCIATLGPLGPASAGATAVVDDLIDDGIVYDATDDTNGLDFLDDVPGNAIIVVTPGTDDATLFPRIYPLMGSRTTLVVNYPESFGPIIAGKTGTLPFLAPLYDDSKDVAVDRNLDVMRAFAGAAPGGPPMVVYTGYSQGADAVGNAAEIAHEGGDLDPTRTRIVLVSDPRSPWGIKSWLADTPILPQIAGVIGIESDGARNPGATGNTPVTSVIVVGDPVANFQWVWYRPVSSLIVDAAGFLTVHSGNGPQTYADINRFDDPTVYHSVDGNTRYEVYDVGHPLALATQWVHDELGIPYTADDVEDWNRAAEAFYPMQRPGVENSAVPVTAAPTPYSVTMTSAAATGAPDTGADQRQSRAATDTSATDPTDDPSPTSARISPSTSEIAAAPDPVPQAPEPTPPTTQSTPPSVDTGPSVDNQVPAPSVDNQVPAPTVVADSPDDHADNTPDTTGPSAESASGSADPDSGVAPDTVSSPETDTSPETAASTDDASAGSTEN